MATKQALLARLALARDAKVKKREGLAKPGGEVLQEEPLAREVPADAQRELAADVAKDAMVMGWAKAIQKHAYEHRIPEDEVKRLLDEALAYNDKADPPGRIDELEDWRIEKQGRSTLVPRT